MPTETTPNKKWSGKSRGGSAGYKIFVFILKYLGIRTAYFVLLFVAFYFLLFSPKSTKASYAYFRKRFGWGRFASVWAVYRTYYAFGQSLLDKTAVLAGLSDRFTFEFDGEHNLEAMRNAQKGALLIGGHLGNWDIAGSYLRRRGIGTSANIHVVMLDAEHQRIKAVLERVHTDEPLSIIAIKEDMSHVYQISQAIANNDIICIHGDRFLPGTKTVMATFFGQPAAFPLGVFQLAVRMKIPCTFVFAMKESAKHYHFFSTTPTIYTGTIEQAVQHFADKLEEMARRYPYQWYNFFDFWAEPPAEKSKTA